MRHYIEMHSNYIQLNGFDKISGKITFCLYDGGVVISSIIDTNRKYYHHTVINEDKKIIDMQLCEKLRNEREYFDEIDFFYTGDSYMEVKPRRKIKKK